MKTHTFLSSAMLLAFAAGSFLAARAAPVSAAWTNTAGVEIQGEFLSLDATTLAIRKDGKIFRIPMAKLSLASREQARQLAAAVPQPEPANAGDPTAAMATKQTDPDHQRKLAVSVLGKNGTVEIWRGSGFLTVTNPYDLPKGKLSLKSIESTKAPFGDDDAALLNGCRDLTNLKIHRGTMTTLPLKSLAALASLDICQCRVDSSVYKGLQGNPNLKQISISDTNGPLGGEIIAIVASCRNLEGITIGHSGLEKVSLQPLKHLRFLKYLCLGGNALTADELMVLTEIPTLDSLNLYRMNLRSEKLDFLQKLRNTTSLNLGDCKLPPNAMACVAAMPKLTSLELYHSDVTDDMLAGLGGKKSLLHLGLSQTSVIGEGFAKMRPLPQLETLSLGPTPTTDDGVHAIVTACPALKLIYLNAKRLGSGSITTLTGLKQLTELQLSEMPALDPIWLVTLAGMKKLSILGLSESSLCDAHLPLLDPLKGSLGQLIIQNTRITDASLPELRKMRALKVLDIKGTDISRYAMLELRKDMPACEIRY